VPIGAAAVAEGSSFLGRGSRFDGGSSSSESSVSLSPVLRITEVLPPRVGETVPARVSAGESHACRMGRDHVALALGIVHWSAEVTVDLSRYAPFIRAEWDQLREHDVVFLIAIERFLVGWVMLFGSLAALGFCVLRN
jgi:hypothetical protein